jgi:hypothetical protein
MQENDKLLMEMADMRSKLEEAVTDSALFALQEANKAMKTRYMKLEKKVEHQQALLSQSATRMVSIAL